MSGTYGYHTKDAIRVKVKKCEGHLQPEYRKFSVDPQITSFEVLQSLLIRAFDVRGEFAISYLAKDDYGQDTYLPLLSDWDLDAAFLGASAPYLRLKVDLKPFQEGSSLEDWDIVTPVEVPRVTPTSDRSTLAGTILNQMEKTINLVQRALNFTNDSADAFKPTKNPLNDSEFHNYLDGNGTLIKPTQLRQSIYQGGVEPSLRRVVWKHLLNVYPVGMTGKERIEYMKRKSYEYARLRDAWQGLVNNGTINDEMQMVTNMVRKDVLRTDRTHKYYAGADDNKNVVALFNILTTYALNHPSVSYCQGMSDLASPLLVTLKDEAQAYVCFCALMKRLKPNFMLDGNAMTLKFQHLSEVLQVYDPEFYLYLKEHQADDLLFCYRWLLLELKREFAFDDALRMLEVLWSSLPVEQPETELELLEEYSPRSQRMSTRENPYTKVRAIRRQSSSTSISTSRPLSTEMRTLQRQESFAEPETSGDDSQDYFPMTTSVTRELRMDLENLNRQLPGSGRYFRFPTEMGESKPLERLPGGDSSGESEDEGSACSESDLSAGDQIRCLHRKRISHHQTRQSRTEEPQDEFEDECGHCNGEIMESDVTSGTAPQLKCVVPIHLVRERSTDEALRGKSSSSSSSSTASSQDDTGCGSAALDVAGDDAMMNSCEEASESVKYSAAAKAQLPRLPPPNDLGGGNPFMIFLSLTLLLQQRDYIMKNRMDYNELAMHLDKMVRKHNVDRVLHQARKLYSEYCNINWNEFNDSCDA